MNTFSNSGLIPSTLHGTRETVDFGTETFDSGIGTDLDIVALRVSKRNLKLVLKSTVKSGYGVERSNSVPQYQKFQKQQIVMH